jgi:hypothetical protein
MMRNIYWVKWFCASSVMVSFLLCPLVCESKEEPKSEAANPSAAADPNVLRPTTNDFVETPEYKEWKQAGANVRDILKLVETIPPGADAGKALEPTVKEMREREDRAVGVMDTLLKSNLVLHGARVEKKRDDIREKWIQMLINDKSMRGKTLYGKTSRLGKISISPNPPKGMQKRAAKTP